jgi:16S rRNA (adenine1518-N6/adenine1519-N6)-dimethyltransferase
MSITELLKHLDIEPKKSLGQNFMISEGALDRLIEAAGVEPDDAVLEIGAGLGSLTDRLAVHARRTVALEIDGRMLDYLRERYKHSPQVEIVEADILETDIGALLGDDAQHYKVVANLPYYITSAVLRYLLEGDYPPTLLAVTVQREVAERITAKPPKMSLLAVSVQFFGKATISAALKAGSFYPRPSVESAVVKIVPHKAGPPLSPDDTVRFFRMVRAGFSQSRKQVKNSLAAGLHRDKESTVDWLSGAGIDPHRRAETIAVAEWLALFRAWDGDQ